MKTRLGEWRRRRGLTQVEVADAAGMTQPNYNRLENGSQGISVVQLREFSRVLKVSMEDLLIGGNQTVHTVSLMGYVGAGDMYYPDPERGPWVEIEQVEAPPGCDDLVAVRVKGDSMAPLYRDGYLLYTKGPSGADPEGCIGEDCLVQLRNGACYLKTLRKGAQPGRYTLDSYNPKIDPIEDVEIEWAAPVEWVRRVRG